MHTIDVLLCYQRFCLSPSETTLNDLLADMQCHVLCLSDDPAEILMGKLDAINPQSYFALINDQASRNTIAAMTA